jgi:NodT family efflux transporter outer membrane factor (OMF) lipoprotein
LNRRLSRTITPLLASALLAGCIVGPKYHRPTPPAADGYAMAGDDANTGAVRAAIGEKVIGDWWTLFHSPALDQLMREAVAGSPTLAEARARLAQAHQAIAAETGLVNADLRLNAQREQANLNAFSGGAFSSFASIPGLPSFPTNPQFNLYTISPTISYNTDIFGGVRRKRESLKAMEEAQAHELDAAYLTLTGQVVEQALIIADANIQTRDLGEIVKSDEDDLAMVRRAEAAGGAAKADVAGLESQVAQDEAAIPIQRQRLAAARHALAVLVGKSPSSWTPPDFDETSGVLPETLPVALPSDLVRQRPDILEAEAKLHAATAEIGVATADLYPKITLSAMLSQDALTPQTLFDPTSTSWSIASGLTTPIFHSGELHAKKREAEDNARIALAQYEVTVLQSFGQVADVLSAIAHDNDVYADDARAVDAASARVEMLRKGYAAGGVTALALLDAERDVRRVRLTLAQKGTGRYADAAELMLVTASVPPGAAAGPLPPKP